MDDRPGIYALIMHLPVQRRIQFGALGKRQLPQLGDLTLQAVELMLDVAACVDRFRVLWGLRMTLGMPPRCRCPVIPGP